MVLFWSVEKQGNGKLVFKKEATSFDSRNLFCDIGILLLDGVSE